MKIVSDDDRTKSLFAPPGFAALAERLRAAGLFLIAMRSDGTICAHDIAASPFFTKYFLPLFESDLIANASVSPAVIDTTVYASPCAPGVVVGAIPWIERRQRAGLLLLAGVDKEFAVTADVRRACSALGVDGDTLTLYAESLVRHDRQSIAAHARMLTGMAADQQRIAAADRELRSLSEKLSGSYEELSLVYQVSGGMRVDRPAADFFEQLCLDLMPVLQARGLGFALRGDVPIKLAPTIYGEVKLSADQLSTLGDALVARLRGRALPFLLVGDVSKDPDLQWLAETAHSLLAVPMGPPERPLGCLFALDKQTGDFDSSDAKLVRSLADESSIYLENARLFDDLHGLLMGLLHSLTSAVDAKDAYTCGHSERVALLSRHLARAAGLKDDEVEQIYVAALLHDVGKIGVPEAVLQKTGKLTEEEFTQMKRHPAIGARILQDVRQLRHILPGVLHHHERFDGRGYPDSMAGQNIPQMGRIICLADSFDAMTSDRTYRRGMPIEVALGEIQKCAGAHFDPALAEVFLKTTADEYRELLRDHGDKARKLLQRRQGKAA
jgi:HD-GYP domain-containing protein (c-di-GMP phosphodiesterase class II)